MRAESGPRGPWRTGDRAALAGANALGLLLTILAWHRAAGAVRPAAQSSDAVLAIAGLVIAGLANTYWLATGRRVVHRQMRLAQAGFLPGLDRPATSRRLSPSEGGEATLVCLPAAGPLVANGEMSMYHAPTCPLVAGKPVAPETPAAHHQAGRRPCGVCQP